MKEFLFITRILITIYLLGVHPELLKASFIWGLKISVGFIMLFLICLLVWFISEKVKTISAEKREYGKR